MVNVSVGSFHPNLPPLISRLSYNPLILWIDPLPWDGGTSRCDFRNAKELRGRFRFSAILIVVLDLVPVIVPPKVLDLLGGTPSKDQGSGRLAASNSHNLVTL